MALSIVLRASLSMSTQQVKYWSPWLASCFSSSTVVVRLTPVIRTRLAFPCGEQRHRPVDAGCAAGQDGDAVGGLLRLALLAVDAVGKDEKPDDEQHEEEQHAIEDEPHAPQEAAEPASALFLFFPHRSLQHLPVGRENRHKSRMHETKALTRCARPNPCFSSVVLEHADDAEP